MSAPMSAGMFSQRTFATARTPRGAIGGRHRLGLVSAAATLLATAPLSAIFAEWAWLFQCLVTVGAVAAAAAIARALRAPVWAQLIAMAGGLLIMLTWLYRSGEELFGVLPTPATLAHFGDLLTQLPAEVRSQALPVPDLDPLLFVTTLGVGLVAILVDLCTVGLRRPALAGLPMLAVYSVPVAVMFSSVPAITFAIGVVGYLWLLGTDNLDRVRRFGRRFTGDGRDVDAWEPSPLAAAGRRLALVGLVAALMLPLVVPGVTTGLVDRFGSGFIGSGPGEGGSSSTVNLFAALDGLLNRDQTIEMLEVSTDDPDPHYLRIGVADQITAAGFDHRRPRGTPVVGGVESPPPRAGVTSRDHRAEVRILSGYTMPRLPTYPELRGVDGLDQRWRHDPEQQVIFAVEGGAEGQEYAFEFARPEFDPEVLRQSPPLVPDQDLQQLAEIPPDLQEPRVSELVAELTGELDNPYDQVLAIHGYFSRRNGFSYSLETGDATTGSAIVDFLFVNRRGYCVQYAAGMAWMVRELGLPARVAIGFTSGRSRTQGAYTLTNHNAHAWTEVYFAGTGWVPFDATPRASVGGAVSPEWAPDPDSPDRPDTPDSQTGAGGVSPDDPNTPEDDPAFGEDGGQISGSAGAEDTGSWWRWLAIGGSATLVVLALLLVPAAARLRLRRTRLRLRGTRLRGTRLRLRGTRLALRQRAPEPEPPGPQPVATPTGAPPAVVTVDADPGARRRSHAAWDELLDTMIDFGVALNPAESPRVTAARLVRQYRLDRGSTNAAEAEAVRQLGHAEERARYAPTPASPDGLLPALRAARRALASRSSRSTRIRAALLPPSTLLRWRNTTGEVATSVAAAMSRVSDQLGRLSPARLLRSGS